MSKKSISLSFFSSVSAKREKKQDARVAKAPASEATDRLASLTAADMPWLSREGQSALSDVPEASGAPTYKKRTGWR